MNDIVLTQIHEAKENEWHRRHSCSVCGEDIDPRQDARLCDQCVEPGPKHA